MTEAEWSSEKAWFSYTDPAALLNVQKTEKGLSARKLRLFALACCRRIWPLIADETCRRAIEVSERFADGQASEQELGIVYKRIAEFADSLCGNEQEHTAWWVAKAAAHAAKTSSNQDHQWSDTLEVAVNSAGAAWCSSKTEEDIAQTNLVRCIFGNPFRPVTIHPAWLIPTVTTLARTIYVQRAFDRMPELADALESAGCSNEEILAHCRGSGPHAMGCWVVDLILDKG